MRMLGTHRHIWHYDVLYLELAPGAFLGLRAGGGSEALVALTGLAVGVVAV
jgi:hypothetical protein